MNSGVWGRSTSNDVNWPVYSKIFKNIFRRTEKKNPSPCCLLQKITKIEDIKA